MKYEDAVLFAVRHFDAVPCGKGWVGTKPPGCKRAKRAEKTSKPSKPRTTKKTQKKKEPTPGTEHQGYISKGKKFFREYEKELNAELKQWKSKKKEAETEYKKAFREVEKYTRKVLPIPDDVQARFNEADQTWSYFQNIDGGSGVFRKLRSKLTNRMSFNEADKLIELQGVTISSNVDKRIKNDIENDINEFVRLTNGRGLGTLQTIGYTMPRAYANKDRQEINIGGQNDGFYSRSTLLHEFGHHVEYSDPKLEKAAQSFIMSRTTSNEIKRLKDLNPDRGYEDYEMAFPGNFIDPYVGKVYVDGVLTNRTIRGSTEVISMGLQHFAYSSDMVKLYNRDKEHFYLILGAIT